MKMLAPEQNTLLPRAGDDDRAHFRMLEADAIDGVVELDVDAEVVAVEFELVARTQAGVLVEIGQERRHGPVEPQLPVAVIARARFGSRPDRGRFIRLSSTGILLQD